MVESCEWSRPRRQESVLVGLEARAAVGQELRQAPRLPPASEAEVGLLVRVQSCRVDLAEERCAAARAERDSAQQAVWPTCSVPVPMGVSLTPQASPSVRQRRSEALRPRASGQVGAFSEPWKTGDLLQGGAQRASRVLAGQEDRVPPGLA